MTTVANPAVSHIPALDGVRGLAVAMVVIVHAYNRGPDIVGPGEHVPALVDQILRFGWTGVELFFVLSGFLITSILIEARRRKDPLSRFYGRRVARIMPAFLLVCTGVAMLSFVRLGPLVDAVTTDARHRWIFYALSINNYMGWFGIDASEAEKALGPLWSVASEQQFYLVWPLLIYALSETRLRFVLPILLLFNVAARLAALDAGISPGDVYIASATHLDGIIVGSLLALHRQRILALPFVRSSGAAVVAAALLIGTCFAAGSTDGLTLPMQTYGYTLIALAYALLICTALGESMVSRCCRTMPLRTLGKYSYFIYLVHWPLLLVLDHVPIAGGPVTWVAYVALLLLGLTALGAVSWRYFEGPIIGWMRRREPAKTPALARGDIPAL